MELAEAIKESGRRSPLELPPLLFEADRFADDRNLDELSRALAYRAAGNAHQMLNEFEAALSSYEKAISLLETIEQPLELGRTLHAKVGLLHFLCRFDDLLKCADRARELFVGLGDSHRIARLDVNLSHAYHRLDRFDMVLECAERAIPVLESLGDFEGYLAALINSAVALTVRHEFEEAESRYRKALALVETRDLKVWVMHCKYNIAFLDYLRGNTSTSLTKIAALRTEYERQGDRSQECKCWLSEAEIMLEIGDLEMAAEAAQRAEALASQLGLSLERGKSLLAQAAASIRLHRGDPTAFLTEATRCFSAERNTIWNAIAQLQTSLMGEEQGTQEALSQAMAARHHLAGSGLPQHVALADIVIGRLRRSNGEPDLATESFRSAVDQAERGRSDWMQFHALQELAASLVDTAPKAARKNLLQAEGMLDSLWDRLGSDDLKLAFLNDRENVYTRLIRLTADKSAPAAFRFSEKAHSRVLSERLTARVFGLEALQERLSEDETLVEYFIEGQDVLIFTLTTKGLECVRQVNSVAKLQAHQWGLERHIASCSIKWEHLTSASGHLSLTIRTHLRALHRILIEPIAGNLRRRVIVVPHGLLHGIPFHALWDGHRFLLEIHEVGYSPNATLYCAPAAPEPADSSVFVAFAPQGSITAIEEVEEASTGFPGATVLINPSTSELARAFDRPHALVHIAGHVSVDPVGGKLSWIETDQGRLTGRDLTGMSVRTRTLVITGCKTARRTISPGDEWQGMMRDFYMSGASSIVSAFWDIRDSSARSFTREFYRSFSGNNTATAVRETSLRLFDEEAHPYFWAGFGVFMRKTS